MAGDVVCVATTTLPNGLRLMVTVDTHGILLLYGWRDNLVGISLYYCQFLCISFRRC